MWEHTGDTASCAFSKQDASFPFVSAIESASGEELGSVKLYFVVGSADSNRIQFMVCPLHWSDLWKL